MSDPGSGATMGKARLESFSDAVIAVAITLLALELRVPPAHEGAGLLHALGAQWPSYAAYVVSFATIGIIWINHHAVLRLCTVADHALLVANLALLMIVVILPFTTAVFAEYLDRGEGGRTAAVVYGGSYLLMAIGFAVLQATITRRSALLHDTVTATHRARLRRRNLAGILPYGIAAAAGLLSPDLTLGLCPAIALVYALPSQPVD